jgi:hypothetical protein
MLIQVLDDAIYSKTFCMFVKMITFLSCTIFMIVSKYTLPISLVICVCASSFPNLTYSHNVIITCKKVHKVAWIGRFHQIKFIKRTSILT